MAAQEELQEAAQESAATPAEALIAADYRPPATPASRNFTVYKVLGQTFDVDSRYKILDLIGRGAYGMVVAAKEERKSSVDVNGQVFTQQVAIKKIARVFDHATVAKRTLREIRLMRLLQVRPKAHT